MQKLNSNLTRRISFLSTTLTLTPLVAFLFLTLAPSIVLDNTNTVSASSTLTLSATVDPVLSMSVATYNPSTSTYDPTIKNIVMEIPHGTTSTLTSRILTSTNNATGYTLSFKDTDNITDLAPATSTGSTITPVSPNTPLSSFNDNTWGYAVQTTSTSASEPSTPTTYNPVSTTSTPIYDTSSPSSEYHYFTVAAKVGDALTAGSYSDQVVFSLVANQLPYAPDFFNTEYMQDFTPTICNSVATPLASTTDVTADNGADYYVTGSHPTKVPSTKVKDKRDEQEYTIRKLADGNCWMTENLRFGANLDDSPRPWNATTDPNLTNTTTTGANLLADSTDGLINSHIITVASGAKGVDGSTAFNDTTEYYTKPYIAIYDANTIDNVSNTGTKFGALYNYCAATGGTACTASGVTPVVSGSICPTNWGLPALDAQVGTVRGENASYNNLTASYGISANTSAGVTRILSSPLSFPRAGSFADGSSNGRSMTGYGRYWSYTISNVVGGAYALSFYDSEDIYRGNIARRSGRSIRCVLAS